MDQLKIGNFLLIKRQRKKLSQEQLAVKLSVSSKMVSKWETGKCMPDYRVVKRLCYVLGITVSELMNGEEGTENVRECNEEHILELLKRTQELERQKNRLYGMVLMVMGAVLLIVSQAVGGTEIKDFFAGLLLGLSIGEMLTGIYVIRKSFKEK